MATIDDTYNSNRPEAGPTGQGFGAMASDGYFSRAAPPTQYAAMPPAMDAYATSGPIDAMMPRPTGPTPAPQPTDGYYGSDGAPAGIDADTGPRPGLGGALLRGAQAVFSAPAYAGQPGASETVAPSAQTARGPVTSYADNDMGGATPAGAINYGGGPIAGAAAQGPIAAGADQPYASRPTPGNADPNGDNTRLRAIQNANIEGAIEAQSQRQVQERNATQIAQANAANAGQAAERAAGEARVANFRATNGADVVLAGGNQQYNAQRQGIINAAGQANVNLGLANKTANEANIIAGQPVGNPIQDQAATTDTMLHGEEAINRRGQVIRANQTADIQNQLGQQQVEHGKATQALLAKLSDTTLSPKDRQAAQQSYLVSLGKDPAQYKVEHSNGPPVLDSLGQLHPGPQYVHIVNTTTGEVQTMKNQPDAGTAPGAGRAPLPDHVAMLKSDPKKYSAMFDEAYGPGAAAAALGSK